MALVPWNNTSYDTARADILARASQGLGYDFDGYYGYQCWDLGANWYGQVGRQFRTKNSYTGAGGSDSYVVTTWTYPQAYAYNSTNPFVAITNVTDIKRGDMIIWRGGGAIALSGHNGFADEDYNNGKSTIRTLGQNQVNPSPTRGHIPTLNELTKSGILGAFRYTKWTGTIPPDPPEPPVGYILKPANTNIVILKKALQLKRIGYN